MISQDDFVLAALLEEGMIDAGAAEKSRRYAAEHGGTPSEALSALGVVEPRAVAMVRAQISECPFVELGDYSIRFANAALMPREAAESLRGVPLLVCGVMANVGMGVALVLG
ncbi:MAG: hypothetical protein ACK58T_37105, partial [Phycisphaerae bacterium]